MKLTATLETASGVCEFNLNKMMSCDRVVNSGCSAVELLRRMN